MSTRPKRVCRRPLTYWQEFVETDEWYRKELVADVPEDELAAALEDEDFENDTKCESGEEEEESSDADSEDASDADADDASGSESSSAEGSDSESSAGSAGDADDESTADSEEA